MTHREIVVLETRRYSVSQNLNEGHILNFYKGKEKKYVAVFNVLTLKSGMDILGVRETRAGCKRKTAGGYLNSYPIKIN